LITPTKVKESDLGRCCFHTRPLLAVALKSADSSRPPHRCTQQQPHYPIPIAAIIPQITMNASKQMNEKVAEVDEEAISAEVHAVEYIARKAYKAQVVSKASFHISFRYLSKCFAGAGRRRRIQIYSARVCCSISKR
jgi:hypothetical protein